MSERLQRSLLMIFVLYITFLGGTAYPDLVFIHRVVLQVVMILVLGIWMLRLLLKGRPWPATPFDLALGILVIWLFITTIFSTDTRVSLEALWTLLVHIALFYWLVDLMQHGRQRWIFEALFIAAGVVVMVSVLEFVSWYLGLRFAGFTQNWLEIGGLDDPIPPLIHRVSLAFNVSTILANYIALLLPLVLGWAFSVQQKDYRTGLLMLFAGLGGVLVLTFSRGGWMGAMVGVGVFIAFQLRRSPRFSHLLRPKVFIPLVGGGVLLFGAFLVIFSTRSNRSEGDAGRVDMWRSAIEMIGDDPLTGVGVREFGTVFRELRDPAIAQDKLVAAHNVVLNTGAEIGIPGILILLSLSALFLQQWWQGWQAAPPGRQIRLEGILAALAGFAVHSMVDIFTLTANVLPILIIAAYVVAGHHSPQNQAKPETAKNSIQRWVRVPALAILMAYFVWFIQLDRAYYQLLRSMLDIGQDDLASALDRAERARDLDPHLGIYDLHRAYVLGLLANENPESYLDQAIEAHLQTLQDNPTFDLAQANLAGLYLQKGEYALSVPYLQHAIEIYPDTAEFYVFLGRALEEQALQEGRDPATPEVLQAYHDALDVNIDLAMSDFWTADPRYTGRTAALESYFQVGDPGNQLFLAVSRGWQDRAADVLTRLDGSAPFIEAEAQALYAFKMLQDYPAAIEWYTRAIPLRDPEFAASQYAARAEVYWTMGDHEAAEHDARTALFSNSVEGARAYYILALLEMEKREVPPDDEEFNEWLVQAVKPRVVLQYYAGVVYGRPGAFNFLPQLMPPGDPAEVYQPWLLLAERYASDNDPDTKPEDVYEVIAERSPYLNLEAIR